MKNIYWEQNRLTLIDTVNCSFNPHPKGGGGFNPDLHSSLLAKSFFLRCSPNIYFKGILLYLT
jgi:hypothetical protein